MVLFKVKKNSIKIDEVEVIKQTESSIWVNNWKGEPRRQLKSTNYADYFDTWEFAKNHIVNREKRKLEWAKESLKRAEDDYRKSLELSLSGSEV